MKLNRVFSLFVLLPVIAFAQTRLEFEVASIKPSTEQPSGQVDAGLHIDGAQVRCVALSLKNYIDLAYHTKEYQVIGPDWLGSQRFDLSAKLPDGAKAEQVPEMLQALLADRFKMQFHRDKKEFPVYSLGVSKGGFKLTPSADAAATDSADNGNRSLAASGSSKGLGINLGNGSSYLFADNRFEGTKLTMTDLVGGLSRLLDRPVVDMTNVQGRYDFRLEVSPEDYLGMLVQSAVNAGVTLPPQALRAIDMAPKDSLGNALGQIGLSLQSTKSPLDVIVIDSMQKAPSDPY